MYIKETKGYSDLYHYGSILPVLEFINEITQGAFYACLSSLLVMSARLTHVAVRSKTSFNIPSRNMTYKCFQITVDAQRVIFSFYKHNCTFPFLAKVPMCLRLQKWNYWVTEYIHVLVIFLGIDLQLNSIFIRENTQCDMNPLNFPKDLLY